MISMAPDLKTLTEAAEAFIAAGRWQAASRTYARLGELLPQDPDVHHLHGLVLMAQGNGKAALKQIDRAILIRPDLAAYHRSRGDALTSMGALEAAEKNYRQALVLDSTDIHAMINLGNTLYRQNKPSQALKWYQRALSADPSNTRVMNNIGKTTHDRGQLELALHWYDKALAAEPEYAEARFNRAVVRLALGDFPNGWAEYEWRFKRKAANRVYPHDIKSRRWDGAPYAGKHLLVHCEQGMGDVIQFCRYLPKVKALGGQLSVEVHAPLVPLLQTMGEIDQVLCFDPHRPPSGGYDLHLPLLSLPLLFQTTLETIPTDVPYLQASSAKPFQWDTGINPTREMRVGIVWRGSVTDPRRACPFKLMQGLMTIPGTRFFSLQKDLTPCDRESLGRTPHLSHWGDRLGGFDDTATAIQTLDLILSVDTATAHLAGALGKPVWVLLPYAADWRWLTDRQDSPWYPTARLFRQPSAGDWIAVIHQVRASLLDLASARTRPQGHSEKRFAARPSAPQRVSNQRCGGDLRPENGLLKRTITAGADQSDDVEKHFNHAVACHRAREWNQAIGYYEKALALAPDLAAGYQNMGLACYQAGDLNKAAQCYQRFLRLRPDSIDILTSLGAIYAQTGHPTEAQTCYRKALDLDPSNQSVHFNLGNLYLKTGELKSAAAHYRLVLHKNPEHTKALCNLGRAHHRMGDLAESLRLYDRALRLDADQPMVHVNRGVALLLKGQWPQGWREYEWRLKCKTPQPVYPHRLSGGRWGGEPFSGKTILVHGEQGFGDAIQFVRYLPMVKACGGRVVLETHAALLRLFRKLDGVDQLIELSAEHPPQVPYDLHVPLCSLAGLFNVTPFNQPATPQYLCAEEEKMTRWRSRLPSSGYNVGITWAGSDTYPERSCTLKDFTRLGHLQGINWIGLQKGPAAAQLNQTHGTKGFLWANWGEEFEDFSDTAAAIANLDLVLSIDTAVAHLAGAMAKPVWLLLPKVPDWRWLLQRTDTPWYPGMRLFRQEQSRHWRSTMQNIESALKSGPLL